MPHDPYVFALMAALVLFGLYRRFRRLFGRQPLNPHRLKVRVGLLAVVAALVALRGLHGAEFALASLGGLAAGAALAVLGIRLTRFETTPDRVWYTPNGTLGAAIAVLFVGRLIYRLQVIWPAMQGAKDAGASPFAGVQQSPLTLALFGVLIGYYAAYTVGLLLKSGSSNPGAALPPHSPPSGP